MVTRIHKTLITLVLLGSGAVAAQAEGFYLGGNVGRPDYSNSLNGVTGGGSGTGYKLYLGDELTQNFAVEGGLFDLGRKGNDTAHLNARGYYLDGVGRYEFAPGWSALGSLGLGHARFTSTNGDDGSLAVKYGAGIQYDITPRVGLRLQYDRYHFTNAYDTKANAGEYQVGLKFGF